MAPQIIWSSFAIKTYIQNIEYVKAEWTEKEAEKFASAVQRKLQLLTKNPNIGSPTGRRKNVRKAVIHKRLTLIYRYMPTKNEIQLIRFWSTYQNPRRLKF
jgi:plasmid stabilization system protein ParE